MECRGFDEFNFNAVFWLNFFYYLLFSKYTHHIRYNQKFSLPGREGQMRSKVYTINAWRILINFGTLLKYKVILTTSSNYHISYCNIQYTKEQEQYTKEQDRKNKIPVSLVAWKTANIPQCHHWIPHKMTNSILLTFHYPGPSCLKGR